MKPEKPARLPQVVDNEPVETSGIIVLGNLMRNLGGLGTPSLWISISDHRIGRGAGVVAVFTTSLASVTRQRASQAHPKVSLLD